MKNTNKKMHDMKTVKIKDHIENNFAGCDKLITNIGGRRIELDKEQQKEIWEFVYAISSHKEVYTDPEIIATYNEADKLRNAMLVKIKEALYNMPIDDLVKFAKRMFGGGDEMNTTVN